MPKKTTKPKFPFWVLRLTNTELTVLEDALVNCRPSYEHALKEYPTGELNERLKLEYDALERMLAAVQKTITGRRERRGKEPA